MDSYIGGSKVAGELLSANHTNRPTSLRVELAISSFGCFRFFQLWQELLLIDMVSKDEEKKVDEIITAVYRINLHCEQCVRDIKKPLMRTRGVHNVDFDIEKSEIKVEGVIDVTKVHKQIEKLSKRKVELVTQVKGVQETKEAILRTTSLKVNMHCAKCENDLQTRLLKHKGIFDIKTDMKTQNLTVEGTIESEKLLAYIRKKVHRNAEIIISKSEKKEEKIEKIEKPKVEVKSKESTEIVEFKAEKKVEANTKEGNAPYFVHYVYAPQLFSDENPNACIIM